MVLYHLTHCDNVASIRARGILSICATGKRKVVWLVARRRRLWASAHVAARHHWSLADVVVLKIDWPRLRVRRIGNQGVFCTRERADVLPESIVEAYPALAVLGAAADLFQDDN